jgi:hypothetical protein
VALTASQGPSRKINVFSSSTGFTAGIKLAPWSRHLEDVVIPSNQLHLIRIEQEQD